MSKILLFAMQRSGGSYISRVLSGGGMILSEPVLPDDGFLTPEKENIERLLHFQKSAKDYQVVKLCNFKQYLSHLEDRKLSLPDSFLPVCIFRHPFTQIASTLFTFRDWSDNWSAREPFFNAITEYRIHYTTCLKIKAARPETIFAKYEDSIGDQLESFIKSILGDKLSPEILDYATAVKEKNFKLGPDSDGSTWSPSEYALTNKEKAWVCDRLGDVMEALEYAR